MKEKTILKITTKNCLFLSKKYVFILHYFCRSNWKLFTLVKIFKQKKMCFHSFLQSEKHYPQTVEFVIISNPTGEQKRLWIEGSNRVYRMTFHEKQQKHFLKYIQCLKRKTWNFITKTITTNVIHKNIWKTATFLHVQQQSTGHGQISCK